jgi:hypothetical protein
MKYVCNLEAFGEGLPGKQAASYKTDICEILRIPTRCLQLEEKETGPKGV